MLQKTDLDSTLMFYTNFTVKMMGAFKSEQSLFKEAKSLLGMGQWSESISIFVLAVMLVWSVTISSLLTRSFAQLCWSEVRMLTGLMSRLLCTAELAVPYNWLLLFLHSAKLRFTWVCLRLMRFTISKQMVLINWLRYTIQTSFDSLGSANLS